MDAALHQDSGPAEREGLFDLFVDHMIRQDVRFQPIVREPDRRKVARGQLTGVAILHGVRQHSGQPLLDPFAAQACQRRRRPLAQGRFVTIGVGEGEQGAGDSGAAEALRPHHHVLEDR